MDDCEPPKNARKDKQGMTRVHALQELSSTLTCMLQARSRKKGKSSPKGFSKASHAKGLNVAKSNATKRAGADDLLYAKETLAWPSSSRHLAATASR